MFITALFIFTKIWKQPKCPSVDEWIKQLWDIYAMEYYLAVKKKKILPFATAWMELENITLSEAWYVFPLICRPNEQTEPTRKIGTDS